MIKLNSFQGHKDGSMYTNQSMWFINKRKDQNHIVILTDEEKASDKSQYLFMIKTLTKMGIERTYVNITKTIYDKLRNPPSLVLGMDKFDWAPGK